MIILHQEMRAKPEKRDEVMAALAAIIPGGASHRGRRQAGHSPRPTRP
jgi:quinol monooxygenase YgiN